MSTVDKLNKVLETKQAIKEAIESKGQAVGDVFADYPAAIQNIEGGGGSGTFVVPGEMRFAHSTFEKFPDNWDWSEIEKETDLNYLFSECSQLNNIPKIKFKDLQSGLYMFSGCKITDIDTSEWNTSNMTKADNMFNNTRITTSPQMDTSSVTTMNSMFSACAKLKEVENFDTSSAYKMESLFGNCSLLQTVSELDTSNVTTNFSAYNSPFYNCNTLRHFGGFKDLNGTMYLDKCYSLSYESIMNVINKLADGVSGKTLYLHRDLVNQLSDEDIAIATNKGWSLSPSRTITEPVVVTNLNQISGGTYQLVPRLYDFSQYTGKWSSTSKSSLPTTLRYFEADVSNTTNATGMFRGLSDLKWCKLTGTHNITNMSYMFYAATGEIDTSEFDTSSVADMSYMF